MSKFDRTGTLKEQIYLQCDKGNFEKKQLLKSALHHLVVCSERTFQPVFYNVQGCEDHLVKDLSEYSQPH